MNRILNDAVSDVSYCMAGCTHSRKVYVEEQVAPVSVIHSDSRLQD